MVEQDLINALNDCIDRLAAGQTVDDCLRVYPQLAVELHPMLEAGLVAQRARYSDGDVERVRMRMRPQIEGAAQNLRLPRRQPQFRLVAALAAVFTLVFMGASILAETSLPGDALYGVKTTTENVRLFLTNNALEDTFAKRRIAEIHQLLDLNREAQVQFQGKLEVIAGSNWLVSDVDVVVSADTVGADSVEIGDLIQVEAFTTADGRVVAARIQFINDLETEIPQPTVTVEPPVVTDTPSQTATPAPSVTPSPTISETPVITPTVTNTAPATVEPSPTYTPIEAVACTPSVPRGWVPYVVQPNDSLASLAAIIGSTADQLMTANCITDPDNLEVGSIVYGPVYTTNNAAATPVTQIDTGQDFVPTIESSGGSGGMVDDNSSDSSSSDSGDDNESKSGDDSKDKDESESESEDENPSDSHSEDSSSESHD